MERKQQQLIDSLISRALYGIITPQEAEEEAKTSGLPALASRPDSAEFDPMKDSRWTLLQAIHG
jgi:hypothetical protein